MSTKIQRPTRNGLLSELGNSTESRIAWHRHIQETQPIRYRPEYDSWEVFRYKDVKQVVSDYATFSIEKSMPECFPSVLAKCDPPQHRQTRGFMLKGFTSRRIAELTPQIVQIVDELLEPAKASGRLDVGAAFNYPLSARVVADLLGLPPEDQTRFEQWAYQLFAELMGALKRDNTEVLQYFSELLNQRQRDPGNDLMSALLAEEENNTHVTREEIILLCVELMAAGDATTAVLLGRAFFCLCQHPEIYQALRDDPSLIPGAIEEILRYEFAGLSVLRTARHDIVFDGHDIKAGQYVVAWVGAANFDETYFPEASQFDIRRSPNPHLTFSHGVHYCLGAPLARLVVQTALERVVAHFSEMRLDPDRPKQNQEHIGSSELIRSLGVLFTNASV